MRFFFHPDFDVKGFWLCGKNFAERLSGSDGILNFKSLEGSQSEIEP